MSSRHSLQNTLKPTSSHFTPSLPTASSGPCGKFNSQLYRPALCSSCFHTVAAHCAPGAWVQESDAGRVFFRCTATNECLFARPGGAELDDIVARVRAAAAEAAAAAASTSQEPTLGISVADQAKLLEDARAAAEAAWLQRGVGRLGAARTGLAALSRREDEEGVEEDDDDADEDAAGSVLPPATPTMPTPQTPPPPSTTPVAASVLGLGASLDRLALMATLEDAPTARAAQEVTALVSTTYTSPFATTPHVLLPKPPPRKQHHIPQHIAQSPHLESAPLSTFIEPLPPGVHALLVDVRALGSVDGVLVQRVRQAYDETYGAERTLIVTPTTIMAVAPHPTRLGVGVLKWERSLLSLQSLVTQPLLRPQGGGGSAAAAAASAARIPAALLEEDSIALAAGDDLLVVDQLPYDVAPAPTATPSILPPSPPTAAATPASKGVFGGALALLGWARGSASTPPASIAASASAHSTPASVSQRGFVIYGVGALLTFAPERSASMPLLRTVRGGLTAASREGSLLKRKRTEWREHAALGPLAWKRRLVRLEGTALLYYSGGRLKGSIVLDGWVEVARAGGDASGGARSGAIALDDTARSGAFVVRTSTTCHVFQAQTSAEADAWVDAISVVAQHAAAAAQVPVCIVTRGHAEAADMAQAITERRDALIARAATAAAARTAGVPLCAADAAALAAVEAWNNAQTVFVDLEASAVLARLARGVARNASGAGSSSRGGGAGAVSSGDNSSSVTLADALALADALGGVTEELLMQLPRSLAVELCAARGLPLPAAPAGRPPPSPASPSSSPSSSRLPVLPPLPEVFWYYTDPSGHVRGPSPASLCAAWTAAGFFDARTSVRAASLLVRGSAAAAAVAAAASLAGPAFADAWILSDGLTPVAFLPIGTLFATMSDAFSSSAAWAGSFANAMSWAALPVWAAGAGVGDAASIAPAIAGMRSSGAPPDPGLLLDVLGA